MLFHLFAFLCLFVVYVGADECHKCAAGNYTGTLLGADYEIKVPANFSGILILYARDYAASVPAAEAFFGGDAYETPLLLQGYALAGSNYGASGWAVREGILTTTALRLAFMKVARGCYPKKVILYGAGMGGVVALSMAESTSRCLPLSAVVAGCPFGAGTTRTWDAFMDYNLALAATNGGFPYGTAPNAITPGLVYSTDVQPKVTLMLQTPSWFPRMEFQRLMFGIPNQANAYYLLPNPLVYENYFYSTQAMLELEGRAGGVFASNNGTTYSLALADRLYLVNTLGMNALDLQGYLIYMNGHEYAANATARAYLAQYADFSGEITVPVITVHGMYDNVSPPSSESAYFQTVSAAGKASSLFQTYTTGNGHCNFTPDQLLIAINSAAAWAAGTAPTPGNFETSNGFNMSFVPPSWPNFR